MSEGIKGNLYQYLSDGWYLFPVGRDKVPLTPHGLRDAKPTRYEVDEYIKEYPNCNWAGYFPDQLIIDIDPRHGGSIEALEAKIGNLPKTRMHRTGGGGYHIIFRQPIGYGIGNGTNIDGLSGIDRRGNGGYIVLPPSVHENGNIYEVIDASPIVEAPLSLLHSDKPNNNNSNNAVSEIIPEGQRNQTLASLAGSMRRKGMSEAAIEGALLAENRQRCKPPLQEEEVRKIAKSIATYPPEPSNGNKDSVYTCLESSHPDTNHYKTITEIITKGASSMDTITGNQIEQWVMSSSGWFSTEELDRELGIIKPEEKNLRRVALFRLKERGNIEQSQKQNKLYRRIDKSTRLIDFKSSSNRNPLSLQFPLGIERLVNVYPKNIIILAGAPNAGKTAWLLNFTRLNMMSHSVYYFSSEMGENELALRLGKFDGIALDDWNFIAEERSSNFADCIRPDCINIIDFLEISQDFNEIAGQIRQIYDRLNSGIAIIAIQKNPGADLGRGGSFSLEKARLYLSMDSGVTTVTKAKNWVDPEINPNRLKIKYKIVGGCKFIIEQDWHREDGTTVLKPVPITRPRNIELLPNDLEARVETI
jgi:hypothetical protein